MDLQIATVEQEDLVARALETLHGRKPDSPEAIRACLEDPAILMVLAVEDAKPLGCIYGYKLRRPGSSTPRFFVYRIDVDPGHHRKGIGRLLIKAFLEEAKRRGGNVAWVQAKASDPDAQDFYRACQGLEDPDPDILFRFSL